MNNSKISFVKLLLTFIATTALVTGCGVAEDGGTGAGTTSQINNPAAALPPEGTEQTFAVLAGQTVTNTGPSVITGNLGVSPGSAVTGFPPGLVAGGTTHAADAVALQAQNDTTTAYNDLAGQACAADLTGQDLGGMTLVSGVYCFSSSAQLTGGLTLDAEGDPNAVWVFKTGSTLTTASNSSVLLINGAQACNVFWQVGSSATLGTTTSFVGNILALTSITLNNGATVSGRVLARNGAVTLDSNTVTAATCGVPPVSPIPPTLSKSFSPDTIDAGGVSTLTITLSNANATPASLTATLTDTLPSGMTVNPYSIGNTCIQHITHSPGTDLSSVDMTQGAIPANGSCKVTVQVTAAVAGSYVNTLPAGALQTDNGNNAAPAVATLTVTGPTTPETFTPPTIDMGFSPATINAGGVSTLTITLSNANAKLASLTATLTDTLPSGMTVVPYSLGSNCIQNKIHTPGTDLSSVEMMQLGIPAFGSCTVTMQVTTPVAGSYVNTLPAGALQTNVGNNTTPVVSTLTVM